jgi:hypothetical protein
MSHFRSRVITRDMFWAPESPAMPGIAGDSGALCVALGSGAHHFSLGFAPRLRTWSPRRTTWRAYLTNVERSFLSEREGYSKVV